jgi:Zn-dependent peptidase ImmA (M78 family)
MIPKQVKIGPQTFSIEFRSPSSDGMLGDGNLGYTLDQGNLIVISMDISLNKQQVTLMHEILHAMRMIFENGMPKKKASYDKWEHFFIGVYENAFLMMIRDNPELMEWFNGQ